MAAFIDLETTPAAPAPPGVQFNLIDPPTMWPYTVGLCSAAFVMTVPLVLIRVFTKMHIIKRFDLEDYILIAAQLSLINWLVLLMVQPTKGADIWNTSLADLSRFAYWSNLIIILYPPGVLLAKWAVVLQIERIFTVQKGVASWAARSIIWSSTIFYVVIEFCDIFQCIPRQKIWEPQLPGHCLSLNGILLSTAWFNIFANATILAIPLLVVRGLQMNLRRKILASTVFGMTVLATIASIMRTTYSFLYIEHGNPTRNIFPIAYCAGLEIACIVFATSLPTIPRFYEWLRPEILVSESYEVQRSVLPGPRRNWLSLGGSDILLATPTQTTPTHTRHAIADPRDKGVYPQGGIMRTVEFSVAHEV